MIEPLWAFLRDENRDLRVAMATAGLALSEPAGMDVAREAGLRIRPDPQAGDSRIAALGISSARRIATKEI